LQVTLPPTASAERGRRRKHLRSPCLLGFSCSGAWTHAPQRRPRV
jgi:hypothetical protein